MSGRHGARHQGSGWRRPSTPVVVGVSALAAVALAVPASQAVTTASRRAPALGGSAPAPATATTGAKPAARPVTPAAGRATAAAIVDPSAIVVDGAAKGTAIKPDIFGACGSEDADLAIYRQIRLPLCRWGGDATSRYNWKVNSSNSGSDWFFFGSSYEGGTTPGAVVDRRIDGAARIGARALVTIPIGPFVEKGPAGVCGFSVRKYGAENVGAGDRLPYDVNGNGPRDCGSGTTAGGKPFTGNDPADTSTRNSPALQAAWVRHLVARYGPSRKSGIVYQLDNEPSNWAFLHRDVVRRRPSYRELIQRGQQYAAAIKKVDPTALVAGPSDIQFAWYPDWGGTANMVAYLKAMKAYEKAHGVRLLDVFTVHYPDANDEHWPKLTDVHAVRKVVDATYPGTQIGFDEWNLASKDRPVQEALATATQLGIFARERVALAAYWGMKDNPNGGAAAAFRLYRNYDGRGRAFGETYLPAANPFGKLSVFPARRRADGALTVAVVNATGSAVAAPVRISGARTGTAQVFRIAGTARIAKGANVKATSRGYRLSFSANSVTLLVLPRA